jgi:hypothetical protein
MGVRTKTRNLHTNFGVKISKVGVREGVFEDP